VPELPSVQSEDHVRLFSLDDATVSSRLYANLPEDSPYRMWGALVMDERCNVELLSRVEPCLKRVAEEQLAQSSFIGLGREEEEERQQRGDGDAEMEDDDAPVGAGEAALQGPAQSAPIISFIFSWPPIAGSSVLGEEPPMATGEAPPAAGQEAVGGA
jgi:hypothetical protein